MLRENQKNPVRTNTSRSMVIESRFRTGSACKTARNAREKRTKSKNARPRCERVPNVSPGPLIKPRKERGPHGVSFRPPKTHLVRNLVYSYNRSYKKRDQRSKLILSVPSTIQVPKDEYPAPSCGQSHERKRKNQSHPCLPELPCDVSTEPCSWWSQSLRT